MGVTGSNEIKTVGHVDLRNRLSEVVAEVSRGTSIAITNRNRVEAFLIAPAEYENLVDTEQQLQRLRASLPVLLAAVRSELAYPSEALRSLIGSDLSIDWQRMNAFQTAFPMEATVDDDGQPIGSFAGPLQHEPVAELDDELRYA